jgi:hypothetical protein
VNVLDSPDFQRMLQWWKHPRGGGGYASIAFAGTGMGMLPNQSVALKDILRSLTSELHTVVFHHGNWIGAASEAHELAMPVSKVHVHSPFVALTGRPEDKAMQRCAGACIGHVNMPPRLAVVRNEDMANECHLLVVVPGFDLQYDTIPSVTIIINPLTGEPERVETPYIDYLNAYAQARVRRSVLTLLPEPYTLRVH